MAVGACAVLLTAAMLWQSGRTDGVVELHTAVEHGKTNLYASVGYLHPNGARYWFNVPPVYRDGDTVHVVFDRRYPKWAVVQSPRMLGALLFFGVGGLGLIAFGAFSHRRLPRSISHSYAS